LISNKLIHHFFSILSFSLQNWVIGRWNKSCPGGRTGASERGEVVRKGGRRVNKVQKWYLLKLFLELGEGYWLRWGLVKCLFSLAMK
jgi:hypothetical protein